MQSLHTIRESLLPATIGLTRGSSAISSLRPKPHVRITRTCYLRNFGCILRSATTTLIKLGMFNDVIDSNEFIISIKSITAVMSNLNKKTVNSYFTKPIIVFAKQKTRSFIVLITGDRGIIIEEIVFRHGSTKRIKNKKIKNI